MDIFAFERGMERVHMSPCPFSLTQTRAYLLSFVETQLINSGWLKRLGVEVLRTVTMEEAAASDQVAVDELEVTRETGRIKQHLEDASASTRMIKQYRVHLQVPPAFHPTVLPIIWCCLLSRATRPHPSMCRMVWNS